MDSSSHQMWRCIKFKVKRFSVKGKKIWTKIMQQNTRQRPHLRYEIVKGIKT